MTATDSGGPPDAYPGGPPQPTCTPRHAPRKDEPVTTITENATRDVLSAARDLAARWQITPRWRDRLTPDAIRLVDAVIEFERAEVTR